MNLHDPFMAGAILIIATGLRLEIGASNRFQWLPAGYRALIRAVAIIFVLGTASNWPFIAVAAVAVSLTECFTQFAVKAAPEKQYFLMMIMSLVRLTLIAVVLGHPQIVSDFGIAIKSTVSFLSDHSLLVLK